jgi:hypothetical protein
VQIRRNTIAVLILSCLIVVLVATLCLSSAEEEPDVAIDFAGSSNSLQGPVTMLRLTNQGKTTIRLNAFCTIYWTNALGVSTNLFYDHHLGYVIIHPGRSELVAVAAPSDAKVWESAFTYEVRPWVGRRLWNRIRFFLPGTWVPNNSFLGRLGPVVTNANSFDESAPAIDK